MNTTHRRTGFTLIEVLIVLGIIVLVAAIVVPVSLALTDRNFVPRGASMIESALTVAKSRAVAEKKRSGIRLVAADINLRQTALAGTPAHAWYNQIQFIEDPGDFIEAWVWGRATTPPPADPAIVEAPIGGIIQPFWAMGTPSAAIPVVGFDAVTIKGATPVVITPGVDVRYHYTNVPVITVPNGSATVMSVERNRMLFGPISALAGGNTWVGVAGGHQGQRLRFSFNAGNDVDAAVQPGDKVEVHGVGEIFNIVGVVPTYDIGNIAGDRIHVSALVLDRPIPRDINVPLNGRPNYRIIRQPRAIPSVQSIKLPQEVVVDLNPVFLVGAVKNPLDVNTTIYMSGVGSGNTTPAGKLGTGVLTTEITGLTTATLGQSAPPYIDILFSPSGEVVQTSQSFGAGSAFVVGVDDLIALWVHQIGEPNLWAARQPTAAQGNADNQALVAIHARTGMIGSYPVGVPGTYADPLVFVRAGAGRTSADTGP